MTIKSIKKKLLWSLGNNLAGFFINVLCKSLKIEETNKSSIEKLLKNNSNFVVAFWHGTMLVPWYILRNSNFSAIISKSNDGNILSRILINWNFDVKRGSSSKGGKEVLESLITSAKEGKSIAITPDGPKGPEKIMKAGAAIIAKKAEIPIVLLGVNYKKSLQLKSWDKFLIPKLFSRVQIVYSDPIYINKELSYDETNEMIKSLEIKLNETQQLAKENC